MEDWQKKLEAMRSGLPKQTDSFVINDALIVPAAKKEIVSVKPSDRDSVEVEKDDVRTRTDYDEQVKKEILEKESYDNDPDFLEVVIILGLKKGQNRYFRIRDIFYHATRTDVDYEVNRYLTFTNEKVLSIKKKLRVQGYKSAAYRFWLSAQPEGMRYGKQVKEERLSQAEYYAKQARTTLQEIIDGHEQRLK
ncbi:MAG: hypothetical protein WCV83_01635 [Candidatus Magasanikbacteria bacterium]|jgi:hypothetical protein